MQGSIYLWSWRATRASWNGRKKEVAAVVLAELQWSSTEIPYLSLGTCPGIHVVCMKCHMVKYMDKKKSQYKYAESVWAVLNNNVPITGEICMHICRKSEGKTDV